MNPNPMNGMDALRKWRTRCCDVGDSTVADAVVVSVVVVSAVVVGIRRCIPPRNRGGGGYRRMRTAEDDDDGIAIHNRTGRIERKGEDAIVI